MTDRVKPLGLENLADGGDQTVPIPTEIDPSEDLLSAKGIAFEDTDTTNIESVSGSIVVRTNSLDRLTILSTGEVGVNKTPLTTFDVNGDLAIRQLNSSSTGNQNNFSSNDASFIRFTNNTGPTVSGFANGSEGKILVIHYSGTGTLTLLNDSTSSSAANRMTIGAPVYLRQNESFALIYDGTAARWKPLTDRSKFNIPYQFIGKMDFTQYLYAWTFTNNKRSGDATNGYRFENSAPAIAPRRGTVVRAVGRIRGVAKSTGGANDANMTMRFELWSVGLTGSEGTKLGDVNFVFPTAGLTIGTFWNSSIVTNLNTNVSLNVPVLEGELLGLKFISTTGNANVVSVENVTVNLEIL